jgi:AhpD family alkylhydroperoxidase
MRPSPMRLSLWCNESWMSQRLRYTDLAPEGIAAMRALEHYLNATSGLGAVLLELVRLRVSQVNGCEYCIGMHSHELLKHHEPQSRINAVTGWRSSDAFTARERAAFAWAEAVTDIQQGHADDAVYAEARGAFDEKELVDLTLAIAGINSWNRMAISFRAEHHEHYEQAPEPAADPSTEDAAQAGADESTAKPGSKLQRGSQTDAASGAADDDGSSDGSSGAENRSAVGDDGGKVAED